MIKATTYVIRHWMVKFTRRLNKADANAVQESNFVHDTGETRKSDSRLFGIYA